MTVTAAHVAEVGHAGEVVGCQGLQHQLGIDIGVTAHGLIEHGPIAGVLDRIVKLGLTKLPDKGVRLLARVREARQPV
jgi:hypothetical protein